MRVAFAPDLHLEFHPAITLTGISKADVLVIAGDVGIHPDHLSFFGLSPSFAVFRADYFCFGQPRILRRGFP